MSKKRRRRRQPKNKNSKAYRKFMRRKLARKCLKLWTEIARVRAKNRCEVCRMINGSLNKKGKPRRLNAHHIEDKMNWATRFDPENSILLCPAHHKFHTNSAHRSPLWFIRRLRRIRGMETIKYLLKARKLHQQYSDWTFSMLNRQKKTLERYLNKLKR